MQRGKRLADVMRPVYDGRRVMSTRIDDLLRLQQSPHMPSARRHDAVPIFQIARLCTTPPFFCVLIQPVSTFCLVIIRTRS